MSLLMGYKTSEVPNKGKKTACRLNRSIYGLKQAFLSSGLLNFSLHYIDMDLYDRRLIIPFSLVAVVQLSLLY